MTAKDVLALLALRHKKDVFVPECKGGPTWFTSHRRLDAWAMRKSWASPRVWGYEVKVSVADFRADDKWTDYLKFCNAFYFVAPKGLLTAAMIPPQAGLLEACGSRLIERKKPEVRDDPIPEELYRYLLMNRVTIQREREADGREERLARWRERIASGQDIAQFGHLLGSRMAREMRELRADNERLRRENEALALFRERLTELGVCAGHPVATWIVEQAVDRLRGKIPERLRGDLRNARDALGRILEFIDSKGD